MNKEFDAIFFDLGDTLRILYKNKTWQNRAKRKMAEMVHSDLPPEEFYQMLEERYKPYREWAFREKREANEEELFCKWLLPDYKDQEELRKMAYDLGFQYRQCSGRRFVVDGGPEVVKTLKARGYKLGIISNLITTYEVPDWLRDDGLAEYFDSVVLSAVCGIRKPDPEIYLMGAREVGVPPERCAYIGDNVNRDVTGSKAAKFGLNIICCSPEKRAENQCDDSNRPDAFIEDFSRLLDIFPGNSRVDLSVEGVLPPDAV